MMISTDAGAQTTQAVVLGRVTDQASGIPLAASITCEQFDGPSRFEIQTAPDGTYVFLSLPPGIYRLTVNAGGVYRSTQLYNLTAPVGGFLEQDFELRPLTDLWQRGRPRTLVAKDGKTVLTFYGPDVDTSRTFTVEQAGGIRGSLEPSLSEVVRSPFERLPLAGRDAYTLIALQPGVASDTSTTRGLGVSVNGQRPSASSYLLDGLEFNNYLITGPLAPIPPEAIEEYRISTNNFSAEYGRTSGFLANTITKSGGPVWHGVGYAYLKNEALDAAAAGRTQRLPARENQQGIQFGGPLPVSGFFTSSLFQFTNLRSWADAVPFNFPTRAYIANLPVGSLASLILNRYSPPGSSAQEAILLRPSDSVSTFTALERLDYSPNNMATRYFARLAVSRQSDPYFIWSPYKDFNSTLDNNSAALAAGYSHNYALGLTTEIRGSLGKDALQWNRPVPSIPLLSVPGFTLPGNTASYYFSNRGESGELDANLFLSTGRHIIKTGAGVLSRGLRAQLNAPQTTTLYSFADLNAFANGQPLNVRFQAARLGNIPAFADGAQEKDYRYTQFFSFAQDSYRVSSRFLIHLGARYESFGAPVNTGSNKDALLKLGPTGSFTDRLSTATLNTPNSSDEQLYTPDRSNIAIRGGFAWNLRENGKTSFRGGYGIYYDRPFDNLWLNASLNNAVVASARIGTTINYLQPLPSILPSLNANGAADSVAITLFQPGIRSPYSQSIFAGLQHAFNRSFLTELNYSGSLGRRLITTDVVNRKNSTCAPASIPGDDCRYNRAYQDDFSYIANQGFSNYNAFTASLRANASFVNGGIHYTWSHAIDNQTEPLTALTANLETSRLSGPPIQVRPAAFTEQFNSSGDKGNADFDQRHTLTFYSVWAISSSWDHSRYGRWLRGWEVSQVGALRSGQPYTVYTSSKTIFSSYARGTPGLLIYNRANLADPSQLKQNTGSYGAGVRLVNPDSFSDPINALGSTGRNEFRGPGLYSIDLSLSRSFPLRRFGKASRAIIRVDAYNVLNHANLNNLTTAASVCCFGNSEFGVAEYGREDQRSSLPSASPLNETARQVQLMLKLLF